MNKKIQDLVKAIKQGKIFIYPTDTVYGLGCDATNEKSVEKVKQIKSREKNKPLSIIAPSIKWIKENCIIDVDLSKYLPGPYTLILKKKNSDFLSWISPLSTLGIRIPKHDFTKIIQEANAPFITTSINLAGENPATKIKDIDKNILNKVDIVIKAADESTLSGQPSTLVINGKEIKRK